MAVVKNFLQAFEAASKKVDCVHMAPNLLLVEELDMYKEYETANNSKIVLADTTGNVNNANALKPVFARVLAIGSEVTAVSPGDYILVGKNSIGKMSYFGKMKTYGELDFGLAKDDEILMSWVGRAGFDNYFDTLINNL